MNALVENQVFAACIFDGKPSAPHGEHHYREDNHGSGKGMGGAHQHLDTLICCRDCHQGLHARSIVVDELNAYIVKFHDRHGNKGERVLGVSDEELATKWADAAEQGRNAILAQARCAYAFRQRYGWTGARWYERASDLIKQHTGLSVPAGSMYTLASIGTFLAALPEGADAAGALETVGVTVASALGKVNADATLIEEAMVAVEGGERKTVVAKSIRGVSDSESPKCDVMGVHICRHCGGSFEA